MVCRLSVYFTVALLAFATVKEASAGVIADASVSGDGLGTVDITGFATGAPNNDDFDGAGNPNFLNLEKTFGSSGVIDIQFRADQSGGITEYLISELVLSGSWFGYVWQLGTFSQGVFNLLPSNSFDLAFDITGGTVSPFGTVDTFEFNQLVVTGTTTNPGDVIAISLSLDVGDLIENFVLRQFPLVQERRVPEPSALGIFLIGTIFLFGTAAARRRERRSGCMAEDLS